jgi:RNA-directed DNA polymerase
MRAELVLPALSALSGPSKRPESASAFHRAIQASDEACHLDEPSRARPAPVPRRRGAYERWLLGWDIQQGGGGGQSVEWFFDSIDQDTLMGLAKERICDRRVLKLLRQWLEAGVMEDGSIRETLAGTPQGGVISPLLANIYLNALDRAWYAKARPLGVLVRYADDFVVLCKTASAAREAHKRAQEILTRLGLELHPEKTRAVDLRRGREGFDFLGCTLRKRRSILRRPDCHFLQRWPSARAMKRLRERVHELTAVRGNPAGEVMGIITALNPVLRGWGNYFRTGNADDKFNHLDSYVSQRIRRWLWRRGGQRRRFRFQHWPSTRLYAMGLHRLQGTIRYPSHATSARPSVSRVPETGTHGLKGGPTVGASPMLRRQ